jgi:hypothetical protein
MSGRRAVARLRRDEADNNTERVRLTMDEGRLTDLFAEIVAQSVNRPSSIVNLMA